MFASFTRSAILSSVPTTVFCFGVVPHLMTAIGVFDGIPFFFRFSVIFGRFLTPMRNTIVPIPFVRELQSIEELFFSGSSCPVTKAMVEVNFL